MKRAVANIPELIMFTSFVIILVFIINGCTKIKGGSSVKTDLATSSTGGEQRTEARNLRVEVNPSGMVAIFVNEDKSATTQPTKHEEQSSAATTQSSIESPNSNINVKGGDSDTIGGVDIRPLKKVFDSSWFLGLILIGAGVGLYFLGNPAGAIVVGGLGILTILYPWVVAVGAIAAIAFFGWSYFRTSQAGKQITMGIDRALNRMPPAEAKKVKDTMAVVHDNTTKKKIDNWKRA